MLDGVSLDQLRTFVAAVDEGSFTAAARKLNRVQSAVSGWVGALEAQIGVELFDRSGRTRKLTPHGELLLADARNILASLDTFKARAKLISSGLEAELSVVVDVFFPTAVMSVVAKAFAARFPLTPLRLFVEGLGAGYAPVLDGRCSLGVLAPLPQEFASLVGEHVGEVLLVTVAAANHPLARLCTAAASAASASTRKPGERQKPRPIARRELARHVQLVLTDRSELTAGRDFGVSSPSTWRLADLSTKHAFILDGLGWGGMPLHMVEADIAAGRLVALHVENMPHTGFPLTMSAYHPADQLPGPAGRWFIDCVKSAYEELAAKPKGVDPAS